MSKNNKTYKLNGKPANKEEYDREMLRRELRSQEKDRNMTEEDREYRVKLFRDNGFLEE